ncbi:hypothetical protein [Dietzia sp. CH92]|uniref:hypothetical protein n=1 Tax=Dietzia sp. CH92 TaxID=3051823 RepID=UPI0028D642A8|nr:hypothetical protein [Dietzia sp. CH92]
MSTRSDRAAERKAVSQAEKDLKKAGSAARKAFDLKDPRFLGEAAVAATRGPVGLALFGASRGLQVLRERRAEQAEILGELAADARQHADSLREKTSALAAPQEKRSPVRRFAPLWIVGLVGGAAVVGATAYFLRDSGSPAASSPPAPKPTPAPPRTPTPAEAATGAPDPATGSSAPQAAASAGAESSKGSGSSGTSEGSNGSEGAETGEDLTIESPDPEGPADQAAESSPAAGSAAPGPAAGSAPQPSDDAATDGAAATDTAADGSDTTGPTTGGSSADS